jgi:hypothetical protein
MADGKALPPTKVESASHLIKALESFNEPGALVAYTRDLFKDNLDARRTAASEKSASASMVGANAQASIANEKVLTSRNERERDDASFKAVQSGLPLFNKALESRDPAQIKSALQNIAMSAAQGSGDASKVLKTMQDRAYQSPNAAIKYEKFDDGIVVVQDGKSVSYITKSGLELPPGYNEEKYDQILKASKNAGVETVLATSPIDGKVRIGYVGPSGEPMETMEAARASKSDAPTPSRLPSVKQGSSGEGLDTQKYIRSPARGGYSYTYSPRGLTKTQWAERDATADSAK